MRVHAEYRNHQINLESTDLDAAARIWHHYVDQIVDGSALRLRLQRENDRLAKEVDRQKANWAWSADKNEKLRKEIIELKTRIIELQEEKEKAEPTTGETIGEGRSIKSLPNGGYYLDGSVDYQTANRRSEALSNAISVTNAEIEANAQVKDTQGVIDRAVAFEKYLAGESPAVTANREAFPNGRTGF